MSQSWDIEKLIERIKKNDLSAFNDIYKLFSPKVLRFAYSFSISQQDAEEVVQDAFLKLWKKRDFIDQSKSLDAFIFVITKNLVLNRIKKYSVEKDHLKKYFYTTNRNLIIDLEDKLNFNEIESCINEIIEELPEKRREIFKLNRFEGLTYKETAKKLNISTGTVEKQMSMALKTIHEKFDHYFKLILLFFLFN